MELIRKYLNSSTEVGDDASADVIETLVDRLQTSTRTEDRRDAMRGIKSLARRYRLEVGTLAMSSCIETLSRDSGDADTVSYALDTLCNILNDDGIDLEPRELVNIPIDLGKQFTEILLKEPENVQLILSCFSSYDAHIRRQAIHLFILMLTNNRKSLQIVLLNTPMAVSKFMDTINDPMEAIRNDGLLLLIKFTKSHSTIQKIVAFENVFEKIFQIVEYETICEGGVVIEDCFCLINQLLVGNIQNQILFKDGRFIRRLAVIFDVIPQELTESCTWSAQKLVNVSCLLKIIRTIVSPSNKIQSVKACQSDVQICGFLNSLWNVVMASGVPADLLMQTLYTIGDVVRSFHSNQKHLAGLVAPSEPTQSAITVLLVTMVNERQQLAVRMAVLYCFQCLLFTNAQIQSEVVSTLLPRISEPIATSPGQLLCTGLFSQYPVTVWLSAIALLHSVLGNQNLKENLLQVHMAPTVGGEPITLMQKCFRLLYQGVQSQGKIGLLQLLCVWLAKCPPAVYAFLSLKSDKDQSKGACLSHLIADAMISDGEEPDIISCLSALLIGICVCYNNDLLEDFNKKNLMETIDRRIGVDDLAKRISQLSRSESFILAIKRPDKQTSDSNDLIFDYEFTQVFKIIEFEVLASLSSYDDAPETTNIVEKNTTEIDHQFIAYQTAIETRDLALQNFQLKIIELDRQLNAAHANLSTQGSQLNDQGITKFKTALDQSEVRIQELENLLKQSQLEKDRIKGENEDLLLMINEQDSLIAELRLQLNTQNHNNPSCEKIMIQPSLSMDLPASTELSLETKTVNVSPTFSKQSFRCESFSNDVSSMQQPITTSQLPSSISSDEQFCKTTSAVYESYEQTTPNLLKCKSIPSNKTSMVGEHITLLFD